MSISNGFAADSYVTPTRSGTVAASYERVSTRMQGVHGFSLGAQHASLEAFATAQGWALPDHLRFRDGEDADASGADWDLPGLTSMLEAARRREFSVLVVPDLDRFARTMVKGLVLEEQLRSYGANVVYQRVPTDNTPEGQLLKHQLFSFAEYERQKTRLRTTMGKRRKAEIGQVVGGGPPPYGYRYTRNTLGRACGLQPDPITSPVVLRILAALRTQSVMGVTAALNQENSPAHAAAGGRPKPSGGSPPTRYVWAFGFTANTGAGSRQTTTSVSGFPSRR